MKNLKKDKLVKEITVDMLSVTKRYFQNLMLMPLENVTYIEKFAAEIAISLINKELESINAKSIVSDRFYDQIFNEEWDKWVGLYIFTRIVIQDGIFH